MSSEFALGFSGGGVAPLFVFLLVFPPLYVLIPSFDLLCYKIGLGL